MLAVILLSNNRRFPKCFKYQVKSVYVNTRHVNTGQLQIVANTKNCFVPPQEASQSAVNTKRDAHVPAEHTRDNKAKPRKPNPPKNTKQKNVFELKLNPLTSYPARKRFMGRSAALQASCLSIHFCCFPQTVYCGVLSYEKKAGRDMLWPRLRSLSAMCPPLVRRLSALCCWLWPRL